MDTNVPASLHKMVVDENSKLQAENELLRKKNDELTEENTKLHKMIVAFRGGSSGSDKMDKYVELIKHGYFKPALNKDITIDAIVTIICEDGITNINKIAEKLGTSYSTVLRRLKEKNLYPIDKAAIKDFNELFIEDEPESDESQLGTKWDKLLALDI